ncbi:hypothetical protein [Nostoc sp.]
MRKSYLSLFYHSPQRKNNNPRYTILSGKIDDFSHVEGAIAVL